MRAPERCSARKISIDPDAEQKPGVVFRPGTSREFQFPESTDLHGRVKRWDLAICLA
jgi:hypothetical protein